MPWLLSHLATSRYLAYAPCNTTACHPAWVRVTRLGEALKRQLYHREQYQKALEANRQVVLVCERSLAKAQVRVMYAFLVACFTCFTGVASLHSSTCLVAAWSCPLFSPPGTKAGSAVSLAQQSGRHIACVFFVWNHQEAASETVASSRKAEMGSKTGGAGAACQRARPAELWAEGGRAAGDPAHRRGALAARACERAGEQASWNRKDNSGVCVEMYWRRKLGSRAGVTDTPSTVQGQCVQAASSLVSVVGWNGDLLAKMFTYWR